MKRELYKSQDYAGMKVGNLSFYYGYEKFQCRHGIDGDKCPGDCDAEYCFTVERKGKEVWRCGTKTIERCFKNTFDGDEPVEAYLLAGIGLYLETINL